MSRIDEELEEISGILQSQSRSIDLVMDSVCKMTKDWYLCIALLLTLIAATCVQGLLIAEAFKRLDAVEASQEPQP